MAIPSNVCLKKANMEKKRPVILVEFSNGRINREKPGLNYTSYICTTKGLNSITKRILVANSSRLCYTGSNFESDVSKITSSVLKVCVFNKKDSSIKFYNADLFHLKPLIKCPEIIHTEEARTYSEMSSDLMLAFGSKTKRRILNSRMKYGSTAADSGESVDVLTAVSESIVTENKAASLSSGSTSSVIPPQNSSATKVHEIYNINDIISKEEYDVLDSNAGCFLNATFESVQSWKRENKYSAFIIQYMENNVSSMNPHKAKLLCYLHYMLCFLKIGYADLRKKNPVPSVPQPFKQNLIDKFTVQRSMPQRMKDKLLAYTIVLGLELNNYIFSCTILAASTKINLKRMISVSHALGCHISESKHDVTKMIELKLPLYKFQAAPKRKKKLINM